MNYHKKRKKKEGKKKEKKLYAYLRIYARKYGVIHRKIAEIFF